MNAFDVKTCHACGRAITWRKKWERDWPRVKFCSDACRRHKPDEAAHQLEQAILNLLGRRPRAASICPSEVARELAPQGEAWRPLMEPVRRASRRLAARDIIEFTQNGRIVDPATARGPIRLRLARR